jgi:hypothetical protein
MRLLVALAPPTTAGAIRSTFRRKAAIRITDGTDNPSPPRIPLADFGHGTLKTVDFGEPSLLVVKSEQGGILAPDLGCGSVGREASCTV